MYYYEINKSRSNWLLVLNNSYPIKKVLKDREFSLNSNSIDIEANQTYKTTVTLVGLEGKSKSAYLTVILWDSPKNELLRYIKWIDDFSGIPKDYSITFRTPKNAYLAFIGIRINQKTPNKSNFEIGLPNFSLLTLEKTTTFEEQYDELDKNYSEPITLSKSNEDILEKNIAWIFGTARSGTTWLGTQLLQYKSTVTWHEPYIGSHFGLFDGHLGRSDYFFSNKYRKNLLPIVRKLILHRTYLHAHTLKKKIIIKEPNGAAGSKIIMESMPRSKLIYLIRDGRDVVDSLIDAHTQNSWNKELNPFKTKEERFTKIEKYSNGWVNTQILLEKVFENHDKKLRIKVFYEKLRKNTFFEIQKIYEFLQLKIPTSDLTKIIEKYDFDKISNSKKGSGKFNRAASPGKWKENFTEEEKKLLNSIMKKTLKKLGYEI